MQETWVQSLGWEDPLEESMATHSSVLAWRIPMDRGAWRTTVMESRRVRHDTRRTMNVIMSMKGIGNFYHQPKRRNPTKDKKQHHLLNNSSKKRMIQKNKEAPVTCTINGNRNA